MINALRKAVPDGTIVEAEKEVEDGEVVYEIELKSDGKEVEVEIAPDGTVLRFERDDEDEDGDGDHAKKDEEEAEIAAKDLPAAVVAAVRAIYPAGEVEEGEKETEDGRIVYEVEVEAGGKEFRVEVTPEGSILEIEEEDDDEAEDEGEDEDD